MALKETTVRFRADEELLNKLDYCAENTNKSKSDVIRTGIEAYYDKVRDSPVAPVIDKTKGKRVVELFAGVGGFHLGLSHANRGFNTIWANQWEPGKKAQYAFDCYQYHYGRTVECICKDIAEVKEQVPEHELLVGGFPCQDYSVAHTGAEGIRGKKGVLWWEIRDILERRRPPFVLLENVDRLLKSPAKQRGRDFGIMLWCFQQLGYHVEWRVINASEYGFPQRRRRVFMFASRSDTVYCGKTGKSSLEEIISSVGVFAKCFPIQGGFLGQETSVNGMTAEEVSDRFHFPFENGGIMRDGIVYTAEVTPVYEEPAQLGGLLERNVDEKYYLGENLAKWEYLKGAKKIERTARNGHKYQFSEGAITFPDPLDKPSRTMLTSESSVNRSTHVIEDPQTHRYRLLTPMECERLNGFEDDWTNTGMPQKFRYFCMGNALVVGIIERLGGEIANILEDENNS